MLGMVGLLVVGAWGAAGLPDGKLHLWFLDVGQGDAILARLPAGEWVLIDGGPDSSVVQRLSGLMPFYEREIDVVILSHPHADHLNGLVEVFKRYRVKNLLYTGVNYDYVGYQRLLELARGQGVLMRQVGGGGDLLLGKVGLDMIYPQVDLGGRRMENVNNSSVVFRLIYGEFVALFSGDLEKEKEAELVAQEGLNLRADVLKAGHHGSKTSNTLGFLERVKPRRVVISCGVGNKFGHPFAGTMGNFQTVGAAVYRTDLDGTVEVRVEGDGEIRLSTRGKL